MKLRSLRFRISSSDSRDWEKEFDEALRAFAIASRSAVKASCSVRWCVSIFSVIEVTSAAVEADVL